MPSSLFFPKKKRLSFPKSGVCPEVTGIVTFCVQITEAEIEVERENSDNTPTMHSLDIFHCRPRHYLPRTLLDLFGLPLCTACFCCWALLLRMPAAVFKFALLPVRRRTNAPSMHLPPARSTQYDHHTLSSLFITHFQFSSPSLSRFFLPLSVPLCLSILSLSLALSLSLSSLSISLSLSLSCI
jgi:hypothetical protein